MEQVDTDQVRADLARERESHLEFLDEHGADPYSDEVRDLGVGNDGFADSAQATEERSEVLGQIEASRHRIHLIDEALERIEQGSYGVCVDCGKQIAPDRLQVRPLSIRCVDCAD
jgi:DnaK suppressor protein